MKLQLYSVEQAPVAAAGAHDHKPGSADDHTRLPRAAWLPSGHRTLHWHSHQFLIHDCNMPLVEAMNFAI